MCTYIGITLERNLLMSPVFQMKAQFLLIVKSRYLVRLLTNLQIYIALVLDSVSKLERKLCHVNAKVDSEILGL